ncbi:MAG: hypothetical protein ACRDWY_07485 [Actinomycetes bacterium]
MTAIAVTSPDVHLSLDGWQVEVAGRQPGLTRVTRVGPELHVRVGDRLPDGAGSAEPARWLLRSLLTADLHADGTVRLVTRCSPPALVVTGHGASLLPSDCRASARSRLQPGDLLVMCSASTLDGDPEGLVTLLQDGAERARHVDPARLVRHLVRGCMSGAAAVIRRQG